MSERNIADEGQPVDGGKVVFGIEAETDGGLNPVTGQFAASGHLLASTIFDPLATLDADGAPEPYLAEAITPNDDFTVWTIKLRDGVLFHDGTTLDSTAVAGVLEGHRTSIVTSNAVRLFQQIDVVDPLTLTITMSQPWAQFPYALTTQVGYVPAPSMLANPNGPLEPVGTGPFVFDRWDVGSSFVATKNPNYWQEGLPHLNEIEFKPMPDAQSRADALLAGEVDMIHTIQPRDILSLREKDLKMLEVSNGEVTTIALNTGVAPFDDITARQAISYATDIDRLIADAGLGVAEPSRGIFAEGRLGYRPDSNAPAFDLAKAQELTAQYEATHGEPLSFVYKGNDNPDSIAAQQLLKEMWEAAGMQVVITTGPQRTQIINTVIGDYQATDWRNFGSPDADGDAVWWYTSSIGPLGQISLNVPRYSNPSIDAYLDQARATDDPAVRDDLYAKVSAEMNDGFAYVWLERPVWTIAADPQVNGFGVAKNGSISTIGAKTWLADLWVSP